MTILERATFVTETTDRFFAYVFWYLRQKKVRRILFRHPLFVLSDFAKRSAVRGRSIVMFERLTRRERVAELERQWFGDDGEGVMTALFKVQMRVAELRRGNGKVVS
jgi:hypothetical protein